MKTISLLVVVLLLSQPSLSLATGSPFGVSMKDMAYALCDMGAADNESARLACHNEANRITDKNLYDIAMQLCLNNSTTTRNVVHCFADASEKIDILGPPYEAGFSEKIYACENLEYTEQATQNDVVACQRKHFEAAIAQLNKTNPINKSSDNKKSAPHKAAPYKSSPHKSSPNKTTNKSKSAI
jgi:hypothetical protein